MGGDVAGVVHAIYRTALCLECIAAQTGRRVRAITVDLERIGQTMRVQALDERCELCAHEAPVFRIRS